MKSLKENQAAKKLKLRKANVAVVTTAVGGMCVHMVACFQVMYKSQLAAKEKELAALEQVADPSLPAISRSPLLSPRPRVVEPAFNVYSSYCHRLGDGGER
jgi:hypothetical protein